MSDFINLRVYTPDKLVVEDVIKKINVNGKEGSFTILPKHIDYVSSFVDSVIAYVDNNEKTKFLAVNQGILIKTGRNLEISTFNVIKSNSLLELKNVLKLSVEEDNKNEEKRKKINDNLKKMEFLMLNKLTKFRSSNL